MFCSFLPFLILLWFGEVFGFFPLQNCPGFLDVLANCPQRLALTHCPGQWVPDPTTGEEGEGAHGQVGEVCRQQAPSCSCAGLLIESKCKFWMLCSQPLPTSRPSHHIIILSGHKKVGLMGSVPHDWSWAFSMLSLSAKEKWWPKWVSFGMEVFCPREVWKSKVKPFLHYLIHVIQILCPSDVLDLLHWTPRFPQRYSCPWVIVKISVPFGSGWR